MINSFLPSPTEPFVFKSLEAQCCSLCSTGEEYQNFLVGEYGAEKVLRVQKEEKELEKHFSINDPGLMVLCFAVFNSLFPEVFEGSG